MAQSKTDSNLNFVLRAFYPCWDTDLSVVSTIDFLREARFQGIMLFPYYGHSEPNHFPDDVLAARARRLQEVIPQFKKAGFTVGLNIQTAGFTYSPADTVDFGFQYQVGRDGSGNGRSACPLCPQFRDYLARLLNNYAVPDLDYIMIDDDFNYMVGGSLCACPLHMEAFSKAIGREISREEWVQSPDFRPGELGRVWGRIQTDALIGAAGVMERAAHGRNPEVRLGIMGINGWVCDFGADATHRLMRIMRGPDNVPPMVRPGIASYWDWHRWVAHGPNSHYSTLHVNKVLDADIMRLVEMDTGAPWTPYDHGTEHFRYLMERSLGMGVRGFAFLLFPDGPGDSIPKDHAYARMLKENSPRFQAMAELVGHDPEFEGVDSRPVEGVTSVDPTQEHFYGIPSFSLSRIGLPIAPTGHWVTIVYANQPWTIGADRLDGYISGGAIIDAGALQAIGEIGRSDLIGGFTIETWDTHPVGLEMTSHRLCGDAAGRHFSNLGPLRRDCLRLVGDLQDEDVVSWWVDSQFRRVGPAEVAVQVNGRRLFLTAHRLDQQTPERQMLVASPIRQGVFHRVCQWIAGRPLPAVLKDGADVHLFCMRSCGGRRKVLTLYNNGFNRFDRLTLEVDAFPTENPSVRTVSQGGRIVEASGVKLERLSDRWRVALSGDIVPGPMEVRVLAFD